MNLLRLLIPAALATWSVSAYSSTTLVKRPFAGYDSMTKLIIFGDSYSRTGFSIAGTSPSDTNALGNTVSTSSGGQNWVEYLTLEFNSSQFLTYDLAMSGATVNISIIEASEGRDIVSEAKTFISNYANDTSFRGYPVVYAFWIGINDIKQSYLGSDWTGVNLTKYSELIDSYYEVVTELYETGARNFLFLNVPPLEKTPYIQNSGTNSTRYPLIQRAVTDYNTKLFAMAKQIRHSLAYTSVFLYDAHALFSSILKDPSQYTETASIKDITSYCGAYKSVTNNPSYDSEDCDYPLSGYFWINNLHPTWPVHKKIAKEVAALLISGPNFERAL